MREREREIRFLYSIVHACVFATSLLHANPVPSGSQISIIDAATINQPGTYTLARDISGPIIINADNVHINLNNHQVIGGSVGISANDHEDISIYNGIIRNTTQAMTLSICNNVRVSNVDFKENTTGVFIESSTIINFDSVLFTNGTDIQLYVADSDEVNIEKTQFIDNLVVNKNLIAFQQCRNCSFVNCKVAHNEMDMDNDVVFDTSFAIGLGVASSKALALLTTCSDCSCDDNEFLENNFFSTNTTLGTGFAVLLQDNGTANIIKHTTITDTFIPRLVPGIGVHNVIGTIMSNNMLVTENTLLNNSTDIPDLIFGISFFASTTGLVTHNIVSKTTSGGGGAGIAANSDCADIITLENTASFNGTNYTNGIEIYPIADLNQATGVLTSNVVGQEVSCFYNISVD